MSDNNALYAIRSPDGSVSLYIDEEYAVERGVDPAKLVRVEIPRDLFISGTVAANPGIRRPIPRI